MLYRILKELIKNVHIMILNQPVFVTESTVNMWIVHFFSDCIHSVVTHRHTRNPIQPLKRSLQLGKTWRMLSQVNARHMKTNTV